ncbi:hypothetical protein FJU30_19890 [Affinibrenneria salicis]|uniref:Uncharacterized protein n=1 Tax=Affinibrenneria salicis TaxID=2590031 RepID=A0A5J5FUA8_9GAMM|nr:hypothetical protein FJU30_19890 [Affinibrenneria salicis]
MNNYVGLVGTYPVHVSLQRYRFGPYISLLGSYYYDRQRAPIPLYGTYAADSLSACEILNAQDYDNSIIRGSATAPDMSACPFQLSARGDELVGHWRRGDKRYPVRLRRSASLDDSASPPSVLGTPDIPFWGQTETHSFIGVYQRSGGDLALSGVKVLDKRSGKVVQVLNPQRQGCRFGFFMTPIYMNLENGENRSRVLLNCAPGDGPGDKTIEYRLDADSQRYRPVDD